MNDIISLNCIYLNNVFYLYSQNRYGLTKSYHYEREGRFWKPIIPNYQRKSRTAFFQHTFVLGEEETIKEHVEKWENQYYREAEFLLKEFRLKILVAGFPENMIKLL